MANPNDEPTWSARLLTTLPHVLLFGLLASLLCLAELKSRHFARLLQEDGWAEWATFVAFASAAVLGLQNARRAAPRTWARWATLALAAFCLFVAGEEISWGQRLLGFRPANYFLEQNYQQEANLHNLLKGILDTRYMVMLVALSYGVAAPFLVYVWRLPAYLAAQRALLPWFASVAWLEFSYPYELVGELAELVLGLLFVADMSARIPTASPQYAGRRSAVLQGGALAAALAIVPMNDALLSLNTDRYSQAAREDLETLKARLAEGEVAKPALFGKKHVHKRVYTAVQAGYLGLAPKHHYLDPWNNPYWIAFARTGSDGSGCLLLYSFGANRRRDTENPNPAHTDFALQGDDIGVWLDLTPRIQARSSR